jgi:Zn-dependent protease with chaperone function
LEVYDEYQKQEDCRGVIQLEINIPQTPTSLMIRALFFVPGLLLVFVLSIGVMVAVAGGFIGLIFYLIDLLNATVVPSGIIMLLVLGALSGILAILKGMFRVFFSKKSIEPAVKVNLKEEPELANFITELCSIVGTKKPKTIILHAQPTFYVSSKSIGTLNGKTHGRVLAIGFPLLSVLSKNELRAILSHEFAHFTGNDTVYSSLVSPVYVSTVTACNQMEAVLNHKSDDSNVMSIPLAIPYFMLNFYLKIFHSLNMRISRIREEQADILATMTCGTNSFSMGLRKTIAYGEAFALKSTADIVEALKQDKVYVNYYNEFRGELPELYELAIACDNNAYNEQERQDLSHPPLAKRLQYIPGDIEDKFDDEEVALSLLSDVAHYEEQLTDAYTDYIISTHRNYFNANGISV